MLKLKLLRLCTYHNGLKYRIILDGSEKMIGERLWSSEKVGEKDTGIAK